MYIFYCNSAHIDAKDAIQEKGVLGSFTWTGAGWVLAEVLSWEQEGDLQGREGQEAALVGKIQQLKTCERSGTVFTELLFYVNSKRKQRMRDPGSMSCIYCSLEKVFQKQFTELLYCLKFYIILELKSQRD